MKKNGVAQKLHSYLHLRASQDKGWTSVRGCLLADKIYQKAAYLALMAGDNR